MESAFAKHQRDHHEELETLSTAHGNKVQSLTSEAKRAADTHTVDVKRREKTNLDNTNDLQVKKDKTLSDTHDNHTVELDNLEQVKIKRERDHLDAVKALKAAHEEEIRKLHEE
jgi:hypothetical protein